jgi:energy-coupling factor transporter ATP-binding protein EcfA2
LNKPTYVWDTNTEKWYKYNGTAFVETVTPTLTKNFAGVGTRDIEEYNTFNKTTQKWEPRKEYLGARKEAAAKAAIRQVYEKTAEQGVENAPVQSPNVVQTQPTQASVTIPASTTNALTQEEADWLMDNLRLVTETYNSSTLYGSKDIELKQPIVIGDTKITHIDPDAGGTPSIIFERPSGRYMVKLETRNDKMHLSLYKWSDAMGTGESSFYASSDSSSNDRANLEKAGLNPLMEKLYADTNIPDPGTRLGQFQTSNALQQKYGIKRTYKDIVNELKYKQSTQTQVAAPAPTQAPSTTVAQQTIEQSTEISSDAKGLAAALTNPTELAKSKGNLTESYPVEFRGKTYKDAEAAYQALKSTATKDNGPNSTYNLMVEIIKTKLEQYPRLFNGITKQGGSEWILSKTHQPTSKNTVWETGGQNWFIKALNEAYASLQNVKPQVPVSVPIQVNTGEDGILAQRNTPLSYTSGQVQALTEIEALINARQGAYYLLAGYAGTGKTTIAENIARFAQKNRYGVEVIAPTNKAAKVLGTKLSEAQVRDIKPQTIHMTIYGEPDPITKEWTKKLPISKKVIIVDESSMINEELMKDIVEFTKDRNNIVIFMGDGFQLEQIGVDSGLFSSLKDPSIFNKKYGVPLDGGVMLTEVRRQSLDSEILKIATIARMDDKVYVPEKSTEDFEVEKYPTEFQNQFLQSIKNQEDVVAVVATNKERIRLNNFARRVKFTNPTEPILPGETIVAVANATLYRNSEVFNVASVDSMSEPFPVKFKFENDEQTFNVIVANVYNNEGKYVTMLMIPELSRPSLYHAQVMEAAKGNPTLMAFLKREGMVFRDTKNKERLEQSLVIGTYGYAITGHKSQGSQWDKVFVNQNYTAPSWNPARWYYTAITRAARKVIVLQNQNQTKIANDKVEAKLNAVDNTVKIAAFDYIAASDPKANTLKQFYDTLTLEQKQKLGTLEDLFKEYQETPYELSMEEFLDDIKNCKL